jgi:hypothetical protein
MTTSAEAYNQARIDDGTLTIEEITEMVRYWQEGHDLEADGKCGPVTQSTIEAVLAPQVAPTVWTPWNGPLENQPTNRSEVYAMFGSPGGVKLDLDWKKRNIIELHQKYGTRLPGVPSKWYVQVHRLIEPYLREGLRRAMVAAPEYKIERIGSFNFRHLRHDPKRPLSMHSWGIAVDIDPQWNFSKTFPKGKAPKAWSPEYMAIWPNGVPRAFVEAMTSCGFAWGSDWDEDGATDDHTYLDPMHFEWIARDGNGDRV